MGEKAPVDPRLSSSRRTLAQRLDTLKVYREEALRVGDDLAAMDLRDEMITEIYKASLQKLH